MTADDGRIAPRPSPVSEPYWEGCRRHELRLQRCEDCGGWQFYPRALCAACGGAQLGWRTASGRGRVESFTVVHVPLSRAYAADVPYLLALIRLEEGPMMMSNLTACAEADARVGMAVEVTFEPGPENVTLPQFRPSGEAPA